MGCFASVQVLPEPTCVADAVKRDSIMSVQSVPATASSAKYTLSTKFPLNEKEVFIVMRLWHDISRNMVDAGVVMFQRQARFVIHSTCSFNDFPPADVMLISIPMFDML